MKRYVSDMISDEYKDWQNGEQILICTETGTGKTSFIMKKLLPYAVQHNNYIAYICNRKILKEQVTEIIQNQIRALFPDDLAFADNCINHMIIRTYQYCEIAKEYPSFREKTDDDNSYILKDEIMYYIFDEAHYFIQDSIFNYQTNYWTSKKFNDRVTVFLTATPEPLLCFLYGRRHINDIDKKQQFSNEIINYYIAKRQASRTQKIYDIDMETDKFTVEVNTPKKSDIKAHLQEIKPYKEFFSIIDYAVTIIDNNSTLKNNRLRIYNSKKQDYGYITPYYFNDYETLIKRINNNDTEKWLIFVQSESDGIRLFTTLSELCIETAFISAKTVKKKKKYNGQAAYQQIIEYQHFNYKVLIATSVIDCGVSIIDKDVCNIVIDTCDKTTFLQMLGRVRVENQKINLYIKYYGAKQINYHQNIMRCDFINIVLFSLIGEAEVVYDMHAYWKARFKYLSRIEVENAITNAAKRMSKTAIYYIYSSTPPLQYTNEKYGDFQKRAIHVEYSKTAMVKLLYSLYEFEKAYARKDAKEYENNEQKDGDKQEYYFYLEEQLSWIGQTYDKTHWLYYNENMNAITLFLEENSGKPLSYEEQNNFTCKCVELMMKLPNIPRKIKALHNRILRAEKEGKQIKGKDVFNSSWEIMGIPYKITAKQKMKNKERETIWYINRTDNMSL